MDRDGGPRGAGTVVGTAEVSGVIEASERGSYYELGEDVYITLPPGTTAAIGDRFFTFALDTSFGRRGQIVVPTGVVQVVRPAAKPEATIARIVQEFSNISLHQGLLPLTTCARGGGARPGRERSHFARAVDQRRRGPARPAVLRRIERR